MNQAKRLQVVRVLEIYFLLNQKFKKWMMRSLKESWGRIIRFEVGGVTLQITYNNLGCEISCQPQDEETEINEESLKRIVASINYELTRICPPNI